MADPRAWGVCAGYEDASGKWTACPEESVLAIARAMASAWGDSPPWEVPQRVRTLRLDRPLPKVPAGELLLEDGGTMTLRATTARQAELPPDLPAGYHRLRPQGPPQELLLVASPGRCPLPQQRAWGLAVQLYAARSGRSWGIGDFGDLEQLGAWATSLGAGFLLLNPLHAATPGTPQQASPYYPSSRCFYNPLYLDLETLPGFSNLPRCAEVAEEARRLGGERLIHRDRVWELKSTVLESLFDAFTGDPDFEGYRAERGPSLEGFATFCALSERFGRSWPRWPEPYRTPSGHGVRSFSQSREGARRITYHAWVQWRLDRQLGQAARSVPLLHDLAVGVDPGGADAWLWQDVLDLSMRVGAPPDDFNRRGQDWALPPFDPWRLRAAGYGPLIETLRGALRHGRGLRVDHVMGLFRLWWIPPGAEPSEGAYVSYPAEELLDVVTLEAHRAGAYVVGEDLGTVEPRVREELSERNVLSYRLLWFEPEPPARWPERALGAVTTHDLPTIAGAWTGADLEAQRRAGLSGSEEAGRALRERLAQVAGVEEGSGAEDVIEATYAALSEAPCRLLVATLDDAACSEERPNMPGTTKEWPNWRLALPITLEELEGRELPRRVARRLSLAVGTPRHGSRFPRP